MVLTVFALASALPFTGYGFHTLLSEQTKAEFDRYGLPGLRQFVGSMQLLGAAGLLVGLRFGPIGAMAAGGLALMMVLGLVVRIKIGDAPRLMIPAGSLAALNAALVALFQSS